MRNKLKSIIAVGVMSLVFLPNITFAETVEDLTNNNTYIQEQESINIKENEQKVNSVTTTSVKQARSTDNSVLILDGTSSETCSIYTTYNGTERITSINPYSSRDLPILGYANNRYKVMISGVIGWIPNTCANSSTASVVPISSLGTWAMTTGGVSLSGLDVSRYQAVGGKLYNVILYGGKSYGSILSVVIGYTDVPTGLKDKTIYYSYDGIYYYSNYQTMYNNYKAGTRKDAANASNPYYDYYRYVPLRTKTKITSDDPYNSILSDAVSNPGSKISGTMTFTTSCNPDVNTIKTYNGYNSNMYQLRSRGNVTTHENTYYLNTAALYGVMLNESGNGTSNLSRYYNNLFGYGAYDSCPGAAYQYANVGVAIQEYYKVMSKSYASALSYGGYGSHLGNKQSGANVNYATDPHWGYKAAYRYRLLDAKAGTKDLNAYTLGLVDNKKTMTDGVISNEYTNVYSGPSTSSTRLFYFDRNQATVAIVGESGSFYKIINPNSTSTTDSTYNLSYAYISKSYVTVINNNTTDSSNTVEDLSKTYYAIKDGQHYLWGLNNYGQLGNGTRKNVSESNKINISTIIGTNDSVKQVVMDDRNVYILTTNGLVYASGDNTYGQRSYASKTNAFNLVETNGYKITTISVNRYRFRMDINSTNCLYLGRNVVGNNVNEGYWNVNVNKARKVERHSNGKVKSVIDFYGNTNKIATAYYYNTSGIRTEVRYTDYNSNGTLKQLSRHTYKANGNSRAVSTLFFYDNGVITSVEEHIRNNGQLNTTKSGRAYKYTTYYVKGQSKGYKTIRQRYTSNRVLTKSASNLLLSYNTVWNIV